VRRWVLHEIETPDGTRSPVVLDSRDGAERAVLLELRHGEALGEHSVKESTLLLVMEGTISVEAGDESFRRRSRGVGPFRARRAALGHERPRRAILLLLAPWPGEGHHRGDPVERPGVSAS
jgi:hypothetical protein